MTWKFIYTYRERCKTGPAHNRCWNLSPFTSKHTWMRFSKFWNTFPKASLSCSIVQEAPYKIMLLRQWLENLYSTHIPVNPPPLSTRFGLVQWLAFACVQHSRNLAVLSRMPREWKWIQSNSAGFSFVNTDKQVHLKQARRHFERNLVKDVHHRSVSSRNWLKS